MTTPDTPPTSVAAAATPELPGATGTSGRLALRIGLVLAAAAGLWTGVVGHWLPGWLRPRIEAAATETLGTPVRLTDIAIHPWSLRVEAKGLAIGPQAQPWFKLQQAETQLSLESVWRMAPVLRQVRLVKPELLLERQTPERFNITDVIERLSKPAPKPLPDSGPARFAVFNIELQDGALQFEDRVLQQSHRIDQLRLNVPFVSSLPSDVDVTVQPLLAARIDGSPLKVEGKTLPFNVGRRSEVAVQWQDVDLAHWLSAAKPLMPQTMRPDTRSGRLDTDLTIVFEERKSPALPLLAVRGSVKVNHIDVGLPPTPGQGQIDTGWDTLHISGIDAEPLARKAAIGRVALDGLNVALRPAPVNAADASTSPTDKPVGTAPGSSPAQSGASAKAKPAEGAAAGASPWQWSIGQLHIAANHINTQTQAEAPWPQLTQVLLEVKGLADSAKPAAPAADATWQLTVQDEHGGQFQAQGTANPALQRAELDFSLSAWPLAPWLQPLHRQMVPPMKLSDGQLAAKAHVRVTLLPSADAPAPGWSVGGAQVALSNVRVRADALPRQTTPRNDQVVLKAFTLDGIDAEGSLAPQDSGLRRLAIGTLTADQLDAALLRDAQGLMWGQAASNQAAAPTIQPRTQAQTQPNISLGELRCTDCALRITDQTVSPEGVFTLKRTDLSIKGLSNRLDQPLAIVLQTLAQGQGKVRFKGDVRVQPLSVKGALAVANLDLRALQPYMAPHLNVVLTSAAAQAEGRITLSQDVSQGLSARYQGKLGLTDLRLRDSVNDALLLRWASFSLDSADLKYGKEGIDADLGFIALKDFYSRIIVNPNGQLNLANLVRKAEQGEQSITTPQAPGTPGTAATAVASTASVAAAGVAVAPVVAAVSPSAVAVTASAASAPTSVAAATSAPPQLRWQGIHLAQGEVDFTDTYIKPNYSARLTRIAGDISAVSSRAPEPATVEVSGAVDDGAPLRISGKLHPLGAKLATDISGTAKGIELTRLTPYAARYAGYAVEKGTLSVTVHYKLDGGKLEAENQVFLDQLTFGERVDSPDATKLPVLLAVSLLKDTDGNIDIKLPISGSIDDPQFSVGGIIWKVIVNLLSKAITAPFALLTGGSSNELGVVPFAPGSATLDAAARDRLDALSAKLKNRSSLKLEGTGWADPDIDTDGLRLAHVEALMRRAKAKSTGQELSEVSIEPTERSTWLKAAYKAADIKKPRNLVGIAQSLPDDQMMALLKAAAPVGREAMVELADGRANAVKAYLADKLDAERVRLTASKVGAEGQVKEKSGGASVQFSLH